MNKEKLQAILEKHKLWLNSSGEEGKSANLWGADLAGADLEGADLRGADLRGADLQGADLQKADLAGADLGGAYLEGANLRGTDLQGADLGGANLKEADLKEADLKGADLVGAYLEGADLNFCSDIISFTLGKHFGFAQLSTGYVKIGCEGHSISDWLENVEQIGQANNYTDEQIFDYKYILTFIQDKINKLAK